MELKINLNKDQNIWFFSDPHYNHSLLCRGVSPLTDPEETRNFETLEEMNQTIVRNINNVVLENDVLICLGDFSFGGFKNIAVFRNQINCKTLHYVLGNHDHHIEKNKNNIRKLFSSVNDIISLQIKIKQSKNNVENYRFECCHYPLASWKNLGKGIIHLHGHVHLSKNYKLGLGRSLDVGMDGNDLKPYSLYEILNIIGERKINNLKLNHDRHAKKN